MDINLYVHVQIILFNELTCYQEPYPVWKPYETDLILPALLERLLPQE